MRKIIIEIETDSDADIEELARDLACEIGCCSSFFYTETMIVKEGDNEKNVTNRNL